RRPDSWHAQWTLWDIYSREPSLWVRTIHDGGTQTLRFSPDNRLLATAGRQDGLVRLIDVESGETIRTLASTPSSGTRPVVFTADGASLVVGSNDGSLRVWDVGSGRLRHEVVKAVPGLQDLGLTPDNIAVAAAANALQLWSLAEGRQIANLVVPGVISVAVSSTGAFALTGSSDGTVMAIDLARRAPLWQAHAHDGQVNSVAIAPGDRVVVSGGGDTRLHLRRASTGEPMRTIRTENGRVRSLVFTSDGSNLAAGGVWQTRVWNLDAPPRPPRDLGGSDGRTDLHIRPDDRFLATCNGGNGQVRLWDLAPDSRSEHRNAHRRPVVALEMSADGAAIVTADSDAIAEWRPRQSTRGIVDPVRPMSGVSASGDGRWIGIARGEGEVIWDR